MNWLSSMLGPSTADQDHNVVQVNPSQTDNLNTRGTSAASKEHDESRHNQIIAQLDAKLTAITKANLQLSDNSHSFDPPSNETTSQQPPTGWKHQYNELFSLLNRGLLGFNYADTDNSSKSSNYNPGFQQGQTNISAVLMGPKGGGKSFLLERCLSDLSAVAEKRRQRRSTSGGELNDNPVAFRVVRLNGLLYSGGNAVACVREIARQIGEMAGRRQERQQRGEEAGSSNSCSSSRKKAKLNHGSSDGEHQQQSASNELTVHDEGEENDDDTPERVLHLTNRRSGIISNLSLLDEALQTARIDKIPILIILEELESFISRGKKFNKSTSSNAADDAADSNARQLLLYHLLDRVADHKFLVSLVGLTNDLGACSKFEKRVLSRAEGTSKIIYFGRRSTYDDFVDGLLMAFHCQSNGVEDAAMLELRKDVEYVLRGGENCREGSDEMNDHSLVRSVMEHNFMARSMDMRWFCRVLDVALGALASDIEEAKLSYITGTADDDKTLSELNLRLTPYHMAMALTAMGAHVCDIVQGKRHGPSTEGLVLSRWESLLNGPYRGNDPRVRALFDLTGPQVAVLLAARRINARDDTRSTIEDEVDSARKKGTQKKSLLSVAAPLTYQRIHDEYTTSFVASGRYTTGSDRYPSHLLYRAFIELLELDLIRPKKDHSSGGPSQFEHCGTLSNGANLINLPLYVNLGLEDDFVGLLKANTLNCSTALREWGLKIS
ncbi:hypothetical protein ACHAXN_012940 [Cyclotella atomus]